MQKNDLKNEEIWVFVLRKKIRSQKEVEKGKNQLGKGGEEREEAEKNPSKRTAGDCSRGKGLLFKGRQIKEGKAGPRMGMDLGN